MTLLAISYSFEYLCYGSTATINCFTTMGGSTLDVRSIRQILTTKVDPRAARVRLREQNPSNFVFDVPFL